MKNLPSIKKVVVTFTMVMLTWGLLSLSSNYNKLQIRLSSAEYKLGVTEGKLAKEVAPTQLENLANIVDTANTDISSLSNEIANMEYTLGENKKLLESKKDFKFCSEIQLNKYINSELIENDFCNYPENIELLKK